MKIRRARADKAREGGTAVVRARLFHPGTARRALLVLILCFALFDCAAVVALAQSASPTPTPSAQAAVPQQQVRNLSDIAVRFVPAVKRTVEGAMLKRYTFLAMVFAQIIMLAAFIKLQADRPGATRDFFGQCGRSIIILPLIVLGPWLISYLYTLGGQLVFPLRVPLRAAVRELDDTYYRFTTGMFTTTDRGGLHQPMPPGTAGLLGVLSDRDSPVKPVDQLMHPAQ